MLASQELRFGLPDILSGVMRQHPDLDSEDCIMAVWYSGQDGSGHSNQGDGLVVTGAYLIRSDNGTELAKQWVDRLKRTPVKACHMREAMRFEGGFDMPETERDALLEDLANIAQRSHGLCLASPTYPSDLSVLTPKQRQKLGDDPSLYAFEVCVRKAADYARSRDQNSALAVVCDLSTPQESSHFLDIFYRARQKHAALAHTMTSIIFGDDAEFPCIQVADMFAFCYRESLGKLPPRPITTKLLDILCGGEPLRTGTDFLPLSSDL